MDKVLENLITLQLTDLNITKHRKRCGEIPDEIRKIDEQLQEQVKKVDDTKVLLKELEKKIRGNEQQIELNKQQQGKYRTQLFKLKSNREYQALNSEINLLQEKNSQLETEILELYENIDKSKAMLNTCETELKQKTAEISQSKGKWERELSEEMKALEKAELCRQGFIEILSEACVAKYEKLLRKRGSAVCEIIAGNCGGCFVKLRPQLSASVRGNDQLINCEKCGRFLYWSVKSE